MTTGPRPASPGQGRRRHRALVAAAFVVVAPIVVGRATTAAAAPATTTPGGAAVTTVAEAAPTTVAAPSTTSTTVVAARCDPIAPTALLFVGTVVSRQPTIVRFHVDEVRIGPQLGDLEIDVSYVRDARFFDVGTRYLVTAAQDPDTNLYLSKVRTRRGEDPRCTAKDPIYSALANGTPIDTGVFSGLKGTRGKVVRAFLLPLAAVVGALFALVALKWLVIYVGRGVRRLVKGPVRS